MLPSFHSAFVAGGGGGGDGGVDAFPRRRRAGEEAGGGKSALVPPRLPPPPPDERLCFETFLPAVEDSAATATSLLSEPDADFEYDLPHEAAEVDFVANGGGHRFTDPAFSDCSRFLTSLSSPPPPSLSPASSLGSSGFSEEEDTSSTSTFFHLQNLPQHNASTQIKSFAPQTASTTRRQRNSSTSSSSTGGGVHQCRLCPRSFPNASHLEEHVLYRHSDARPHRCPLCPDKAFKTRSNLNQHLRSAAHHGVGVGGAAAKRYVCAPCQRAFGSASGYRYHVLSAHGGAADAQSPPSAAATTSTRRHRCPECGRGFLQNKLLQKHLRSRHSSERRFRCPRCPAAFKRKDHLDRHKARCKKHLQQASSAGVADQDEQDDALREFGDSVTDDAVDAFIRALFLQQDNNDELGMLA